MVDYPNREITHEEEKRLPLLNELCSNSIDGLIILGSQDRKDVNDLISMATNILKIKTILVDNKKEPLISAMSKFPESIPINDDADRFVKKGYLRLFLKAYKISNPMIYDNLCGGTKRIEYWNEILSIMNHIKITAFIHKRHGTHFIVKDKFNLIRKYEINKHNCLMIFSGKEKIETKGYTLEKVDSIPSIIRRNFYHDFINSFLDSKENVLELKSESFNGRTLHTIEQGLYRQFTKRNLVNLKVLHRKDRFFIVKKQIN